jgi:hypothetical protein
MAVRQREWDEILSHGTSPTYHDELANMRELVNDNASRNKRPVPDRHMAGQYRPIRHHHTVAY